MKLINNKVEVIKGEIKENIENVDIKVKEEYQK